MDLLALAADHSRKFGISGHGKPEVEYPGEATTVHLIIGCRDLDRCLLVAAEGEHGVSWPVWEI